MQCEIDPKKSLSPGNWPEGPSEKIFAKAVYKCCSTRTLCRCLKLIMDCDYQVPGVKRANWQVEILLLESLAYPG